MTMTMTWATPLIGIPFQERGRSLAGCDCWGLVRFALGRGVGGAGPGITEGHVPRSSW